MFCGTALSCVEKIIHPAYASLYVQSSVADETTGTGESPMFRLQSPPGAASANRAVDDDNDLEIIDAETENLHKEQRENRQEEQRRSVGGSQPLQLSAVAGPSDNAVTTPRMTTRFSLRSTSPHQPSPVKTVTEKERETDSEEPNELNETNNSGIFNRDTGNITPSKVILKRSPVSTDKQHSVVSSSEKISEPKEMSTERSVRKTIDLTESDKSDEEISEVPCEVDLADSDDGQCSSISICSQDTVSNQAVEMKSPKAASAMANIEVPVPDIVTVTPNGTKTKLNVSDILNPQTEETAASSLTSQDDTAKEAAAESMQICAADTAGDVSKTGKRTADELEGSPSKKPKETEHDSFSVDDEFDDTDAMLMAFADVTHEEEEEEMNKSKE